MINNKQYIKLTNYIKSNVRKLKCGIPQGSIFAPFLFLVYFNSSPPSCKIFNLIISEDHTNLSYEHKYTIKPFITVNKQSKNNNDWCMSNKPSPKVGKMKHSLFHKPSRIDDLPRILPELSINSRVIEK